MIVVLLMNYYGSLCLSFTFSSIQNVALYATYRTVNMLQAHLLSEDDF